MGGSNPTVRMEMNDGEPCMSTITYDEGRFGQSTEYIARGGETVELIFNVKGGDNGVVKAQVYALETKSEA